MPRVVHAITTHKAPWNTKASEIEPRTSVAYPDTLSIFLTTTIRKGKKPKSLLMLSVFLKKNIFLFFS